MASQRLTDKTAFGATLANGDLVHIVDVSDTSQDAAGSSYKLSLATLKSFIDTNIYNSDGTLSSNRSVSMNNFKLSFNNGDTGFGLTAITGTRLSSKSETNTSSNFAFKAVDASDSIVFCVRGDGKVGVGTGSPSSKMHIVNSFSNSINTTFLVDSTYTGTSASIDNSSIYATLTGSSGSFNALAIFANSGTSQANPDILRALQLTATGKGINRALDITCSNSDVGGSTRNWALNINYGNATGGSNIAIQLFASGTIATSDYTLYSELIAAMHHRGKVGIGQINYSPTAMIDVKGNGTGAGYIAIFKDNSNVERFTVKDSGVIYMPVQVGNSGLASGELYADTAANILSNGDYVIGRKV